ncbi:MAG: polysaccharide deacetylase family protein [Clostridia bacterium]|nr:polysaccharide deacetylase family protein [Clostridia bacterium]
MRRHIYRSLFSFLLLFSLLYTSIPIKAYAEEKIYRSVVTQTKQIALTFDDGPHPRLTHEILEILDKYNVKATFFMVGVNVVNYPQAAKEVLERGHEVGNHTYSHYHMRGLNEEALNDELGKCEDALEELCEYRPHLFRPPEGAVTEYVRHCSEGGDYTLVLWSLDTRDWEEKNTARIVQTVLENIQPGDIVLMHDYIGTESKTPEALEILLSKLLEKGYEPVTVSRLLGIC